MGLVTLLLLALPGVARGLLRLPLKLALIYAGIGVLVALHWLAFYAAIKLSNASVAATCLGSATAFTALMEPLVLRKPWQPRNVLLGLAVIPGVALVAGGLSDGQQLGFVVGVLASLAVAIFGSLNKRYVDQADPKVVTALELGAGALFLTLVLPLLPHEGLIYPIPQGRDIWLLGLLVVFGTALPFTLSLVALRQLSAFVTQMAVNLEPVYAVALAALLLGERDELSTQFYVGVVILFAAVFLRPIVVRLRGRRQPAKASTVQSAP